MEERKRRLKEMLLEHEPSSQEELPKELPIDMDMEEEAEPLMPLEEEAPEEDPKAKRLQRLKEALFSK